MARRRSRGRSREELDPNQSSGESAAAAQASSTVSSAGSDPLIADAGPAFDPAVEPEHEDGALPSPPGQTEPLPGWDVHTVSTLLTTQGHALHSLAGVAEDDWIYTRDELAAIAPPLTNILNRYPVTAAAAAGGEELALMIGLGAYVSRSWRTRVEALRARDDQPDAGEHEAAPPVFVPAEAPA